MQKNPLLQYRNIPVTSNMVAACYGSLREPQKRVQALVKTGELIRLRRGLYVVNPDLSGIGIKAHLFANIIYLTSYVTLQRSNSWYVFIH